MIDTFFANGQLNEAAGFVAALIIGVLFGIVLEKAGFGSSKKLSDVFYLRDMVVFKVMASAMATAAIGFTIALKLGYVGTENIYLLPTVWGAYSVGGILFGIGFAMAGWCPGTAAVGMASGKYDAAIFIGGVLIGSVVFNELFPFLTPLYTWGDQGIVYLHETLGVSRDGSLLGLVLVAILAMVVCEWIERRDKTKPLPDGIKSWTISLWTIAQTTAKGDRIFLAMVLSFATLSLGIVMFTTDNSFEQQLLRKIANGEDHIDPDILARRMIKKDESLLVVDVRPQEEYDQFHLKGAINVQLPNLHQSLTQYKNTVDIVLYSNGMTHPAQARDSLQRTGFDNVFMLTDGLNGFITRCLTPISLRSEPVPEPYATEIRLWRTFFLTDNSMNNLALSKNHAGQ